MIRLRAGRLCFLLVLVLLVAGFFWKAELTSLIPFSLTGYAALVYDEPISVQELNAQYAALGPLAETLNKTTLLDQLIAEKLLLREAGRFSVSEEEIEAFLEQNGPGADREGLRTSLLLAKYLNETVLKDVHISDEEVTIYYENNTPEFILPEQARIAHILIKPEGKTDRELDDILQHVLDSLATGRSFEELAQKYSEDTASKEDGGDLGYIYRGQTVTSFDKVAFSTPVNETSVTFKTPMGFHVIKVLDKKPSRLLLFDEVKDKLKLLLLGQKQKAAFDEHVQKLRAEADVRVYFHE